LAEAEARMRRHQAAIEAGVDPAALVEVINQAHAAREAARAELASIAEPTTVHEAEVYAMIDSLGDLGAKLNGDKPTSLAQLYEDLGLQLRYEPKEEANYAEISPRG
jgi:hypothetical protein